MKAWSGPDGAADFFAKKYNVKVGRTVPVFPHLTFSYLVAQSTKRRRQRNTHRHKRWNHA